MCPYSIITSPALTCLCIYPPKLLVYHSFLLPWHPSLFSVVHRVSCPSLELERSGPGPSPALLEQTDVKMSGEVAASFGDIGPAAPGHNSGLCALASACKEAVEPDTECETCSSHCPKCSRQCFCICVKHSSADWAELMKSAMLLERNIVSLCPAAGADREIYYAVFEEGS